MKEKAEDDAANLVDQCFLFTTRKERRAEIHWKALAGIVDFVSDPIQAAGRLARES